jgi:hypothetical protein
MISLYRTAVYKYKDLILLFNLEGRRNIKSQIEFKDDIKYEYNAKHKKHERF